MCRIVGIGGSGGGFEAATELLRHLPPKTGMPFVVVQHLDPHHSSRLPKLLSKVTSMQVIELAETTTPQPDTVYVQPANNASSSYILLTDIGRRITELRPNIDVPDLENILRDVIETLNICVRKVRDMDGRASLLHYR
jgi:chemotaxis response regulator CheB